MSKPEDIPQKIFDAAGMIASDWQMPGGAEYDSLTEQIACAIMAAKADHAVTLFENSNPVLVPDYQGVGIWIDDYDKGVHSVSYEDIYADLLVRKPVFPDEREFRLQVAAKLEDIAAKIRESSGPVDGTT